MTQMNRQGWISGMGLGPNNRGMARHYVPQDWPDRMCLGWPMVKDSRGHWQPVEGAVSSFVKFRKATTPFDLELSSTDFVDEEGPAAFAPQNVDEDVVDPEDLRLEDILKPDFIAPLIETLQLEQLLGPDLPEGQQSAEDILILLQKLPSPFREQMDSFSYALRTGLLDLSCLGLDPSKYNNFTIVSVLEALEDSVANQSRVSGQEDKD